MGSESRQSTLCTKQKFRKSRNATQNKHETCAPYSRKNQGPVAKRHDSLASRFLKSKMLKLCMEFIKKFGIFVLILHTTIILMIWYRVRYSGQIFVMFRLIDRVVHMPCMSQG